MKLISKDNISVVITLILVVLLRQSHIFDFLLETYLGRVILLSFVIFIAVNSKVLGLVAVLAIIIIFNYNHVQNLREIEGLENMPRKPAPKLNDAVDIKAKTELDKKYTRVNLFNKILKPPSGREGFCMSDRETNILRGKRPNSVPMFSNLRSQSDDVIPFEKSDLATDFESV